MEEDEGHVSKITVLTFLSENSHHFNKIVFHRILKKIVLVIFFPFHFEFFIVFFSNGSILAKLHLRG